MNAARTLAAALLLALLARCDGPCGLTADPAGGGTEG